LTAIVAPMRAGAVKGACGCVPADRARASEGFVVVAGLSVLRPGTLLARGGGRCVFSVSSSGMLSSRPRVAGLEGRCTVLGTGPHWVGMTSDQERVVSPRDSEPHRHRGTAHWDVQLLSTTASAVTAVYIATGSGLVSIAVAAVAAVLAIRR
jgi:hypothetical protein